VEYKRPAGAYPLGDFYKICRVCTPFQDALGVASITMPSLVGLGFHPPPGQPKTLSFLFACLFVTLLNISDCVADFAMKALEYRNDFDTIG